MKAPSRELLILGLATPKRRRKKKEKRKEKDCPPARVRRSRKEKKRKKLFPPTILRSTAREKESRESSGGGGDGDVFFFFFSVGGRERVGAIIFGRLDIAKPWEVPPPSPPSSRSRSESAGGFPSFLLLPAALGGPSRSLHWIMGEKRNPHVERRGGKKALNVRLAAVFGMEKQFGKRKEEERGGFSSLSVRGAFGRVFRYPGKKGGGRGGEREFCAGRSRKERKMARSGRWLWASFSPSTLGGIQSWNCKRGKRERERK